MRRQSGVGCLTRLVLVFVVVGAVMWGAIWVFAPWGFYMGGRFHWYPSWQGWGKLHSNSGGGDYAVYIYMYPKGGRGMGTTHVSGTALLCTPRGERFTLSLGGDFERSIRRDTNGKTASFYMNNRNSVGRILGTDRRPSLELRGKWNNPDLVLDDHSSFQRAFKPDATLYPEHASRPYMAEVSQITLHEGSKSDFEAACAAIRTK